MSQQGTFRSDDFTRASGWCLVWLARKKEKRKKKKEPSPHPPGAGLVASFIFFPWVIRIAKSRILIKNKKGERHVLRGKRCGTTLPEKREALIESVEIV